MARAIILASILVLVMCRSWPISVAILAFLPLATPGRPSVPEHQTSRFMKFCQAPSENNPLANPSAADYGNGFKLPACPTSSKPVKNMIRNELDSQVITSGVVDAVGSELTSMKIGRRAFYSVPATTVPGDRDAFMHALYKDGISRSIDKDEPYFY